MKTFRFILAAGSLLLVALTLLLHFRIAATLEARDAETAATRSRLAALAHQSAELARQRERVQKELAAPPPPPPPAAVVAAPPKPPAASLSGEARFQIIARDPQLRALHLQAYLDQRRLVLAGALASIGATPAQRAQLDRIHADYQQKLMDSAVTAAEQGWPANDPRLAALRAQLGEDQNAQRAALFGAGDAALVEANRRQGIQQLANQIAAENLSGPGVLTPAAVSQLGQLMATHHLDPATATAKEEPTGYDWTAILAEASQTFSPAQLAGLQTSVKYHRAEAQLNALGNR